MATVNKIDTTFTGKDIHTAASVYEYTANGTYKVRFQIQLTSLAGGGDYSVWATLNDGDAVGDYVIHPKTTITLAAGAQSIWIVSGEIDVMSGDVINIFALGLAGDTSVAGVVRVFSDDATAVATLADDAITASKYDESTAFPVKSADTGATAIARVGADSDTLETLSDQLDTIKTKTDLLDVSAITVVTAVNGTTITVLRGDTLSGSLTDLGALTDYVSIDFTVKQNYSQTDDEAIIRIRKNASGTDDGLLRLNGAAATANLGSIAIDDLASGDITITLAASCTDDLSTGNYVYDVQMITASAVDTLTYGRLTVSSDVTRAIA